MSVIARSKTSSRRLRRLREARSGAAPAPAAPPAPAVPDARERSRIAARPEDEALYTCGCGFVFAAAVSTSVGCPHCGDAQAW